MLEVKCCLSLFFMYNCSSLCFIALLGQIIIWFVCLVASFSFLPLEWNPALRPLRLYGHFVITATFFGRLTKTTIHFL